MEVSIQKQVAISNINLMRQKIGLYPHDFDFLFSKRIESLRLIQSSLIEHYNQAIINRYKD